MLMFSRVARASQLALAITAVCAGIADAGTNYDGSWSLSIVTDRGACDASYSFQVQIESGIVSHPNLVKLKGRVSSKGSVRVSVTVGEKHASGAGRLSGSSGRGRWTGYSGRDRCSGHWTAER